MKIVLAGGSGFIGRRVAAELESGHDLVVLSRDAARVKAGRGVGWDPRGDGPWMEEIATADAVVNLAGENIGGGRWTAERKRAIRESRTTATAAVVRALRSRPDRRRVLVNASAIGIYGDRGDEILEETSSPGRGFLPEVCLAWEAEAAAADDVARLVIARFGVVLAADGGALPQMALPVRLFAGGPAGSGRQWISWVHWRDVVRFIRWSIERDETRGTYNVTAPDPATNAEFTRTLAAELRRPSLVRAPAFAIRAALGEMGRSLLLEGQRVVPRRASIEQFAFLHRELAAALRDLFRRDGNPEN